MFYKKCKGIVIKKSYSILFFLCSLFLFANQCEAQLIEVVASSGGCYDENGIVVSFTVGESFIELLSAESKVLTQGFQQPNFIITGVNTIRNSAIIIQAYPNPATDFVFINANKILPTGSYYSLTDIHGSLIGKKTITELTTKIPLGQLVPSAYLLNICRQNMILRTFKIIKK